MTKRKSVTHGTPLVVDVFHPERWDYIYSLQKGGISPSASRHAVLKTTS